MTCTRKTLSPCQSTALKHSFAPQRASVFNCINKPSPFMQVTNFCLWMDIRMSCTQSPSTIPLGVCLFTVHRPVSRVRVWSAHGAYDRPSPCRNRIITGSFDKTCKVWDAESGDCLHTLRGHLTEIVCLCFNPQSTLIATGSMDNTAKLWDVNTGSELHTLLVLLRLNSSSGPFLRGIFIHSFCGGLGPRRGILLSRDDFTCRFFCFLHIHLINQGHTAEIVSLNFNTYGDLIITGSFDHTSKLWDVRSGRCVHTLQGHRGEISSTQFNFAGVMCWSFRRLFRGNEAPSLFRSFPYQGISVSLAPSTEHAKSGISNLGNAFLH